MENIGKKFITNQGCTIEIVNYVNNRNVSVKFDNGYILDNIYYSNILKGKVKNPFFRSIYGVGFVGVGDYGTPRKIKNLKCYKIWHSMFFRCYDTKNIKRYPTYKNVTVCEKWHNYQNFAKWFEENYDSNVMEGWHLDKDILIKGNNLYSPETCCFVPSDINYLITKANSIRGDFPIGVRLDKKRGNFHAVLTKYNKPHLIGSYDTPEEAFEAYKIAKEAHIKYIADIWKSTVNNTVYEALINYKVEITD